MPRAGVARSDILKGAGPEDIVRAITAVAAGEFIVGAPVAMRARQLFADGPDAVPHPFPELTARERDILDLLARAWSNAVIAERLQLSEKTIRNNVSNIFAKLRVADRAVAIVRARDAGLGGCTPATGHDLGA